MFLRNAAKSGLKFTVMAFYLFCFDGFLLLKFLPSFNKFWSTQLNPPGIEQRNYYKVLFAWKKTDQRQFDLCIDQIECPEWVKWELEFTCVLFALEKWDLKQREWEWNYSKIRVRK